MAQQLQPLRTCKIYQHEAMQIIIYTYIHILYCSLQKIRYTTHYWTHCISSICCSCGIGASFSALGADFFFLFFLSFSFQLSTLFFQIGFPDSSLSSTRKNRSWLSKGSTKETILEGVGQVSLYHYPLWTQYWHA